jgi:glutamate racemase
MPSETVAAVNLLAGRSHHAHMTVSRHNRVLVFDSGMGGLTVLDAIAQAHPEASLRYLADDAGFPYGAWPEDALIERVVAVLTRHLAREPADVVVIACNTASTLVLPALRAGLNCPVVGTVPAIKPAAERTRTGLVSVLATPGTVRRDYTRQLIAAYASHLTVRLVGATGLAALAEARMRGLPVSDDAVRAEIAPCFESRASDGGEARTDVVVLACTHYPLLLDAYRRLSPWPVHWIDPAPAIARRVVAVLGAGDRPGGTTARANVKPRGEPRGEPPGRASFTSGRAPEAALAQALHARGLSIADGEGVDFPPRAWL